MMVLVLVITMCVILPSLGCDEYYGNISRVLEMRAVDRARVGIFWGQILHNIDEECLVQVELQDSDARTVEVVEDAEEIREKKVFTVEMNICENSNETWQVILSFKQTEGNPISISTEKVSYKVEKFFIDSSVPDYCYIGSQLVVYPLTNLIQPAIYSECITSVDTCECEYCTQCDVIHNTGYTPVIVEKEPGYKEYHLIRFYYYWNYTGGEDSKEVKIQFYQGHCDTQGILGGKYSGNETTKENNIARTARNEKVDVFALKSGESDCFESDQNFSYLFLAIISGLIILLVLALMILIYCWKVRHCWHGKEGQLNAEQTCSKKGPEESTAPEIMDKDIPREAWKKNTD